MHFIGLIPSLIFYNNYTTKIFLCQIVGSKNPYKVVEP